MDSEARRTSEAEARRTTLSRLAEYMESQRDTVTEQWLLAVRRDPNIATADRLTHQQLLDHLPNIYQECCEFLRRRDSYALIDEAQIDAKEHGEFRWQNGYRIDELIRELEAFRRIMATTVLRFVDVDTQFAGTLERQASALIHQFFGEVTVNSVKQFVAEQQAVVSSYTEKMEAANLELAQVNSTLQLTLSERHGMTSVVAHELRNLLQGLTVAARVWDQQPSAEQASVWVRDQIRDLEQLLLQLLHHSSLIEASDTGPDQIDLAILHTELLQQYQVPAAKKGLRLQGEMSVVPQQVSADPSKVRLLAERLLSSAINHTSSGVVALSFSIHDAQRWIMSVSDTGPGLTPAAAEQLFGSIGGSADTPAGHPGMGLAITRSLITALDGSLQVTTQADCGTRIDVILPREAVPSPAAP